MDNSENMISENMSEALEFIVSEQNKHKENQDTKLAFKYAMLYDYFQKNRKNWAKSK